jgi:hypothetical protein
MNIEAFYRYRLEDFYKVSVLQLRVGDELLLNGPYPWDKFGVLSVTSVLFPLGDWMMYKYWLPVGVDVSSAEDQIVHVTWQGQIPCIEVDVWISIAKSLYVLRK